MDLRTYLRAIGKSWWLIIIIVALGVGASLFRNATATPIYAGDVTFYVSTATSAQDSPVAGDQFAQQRAVSYAKLLSSDALAKRVIRSTGVQIGVGALADEISGSADLNTVLVTASVNDASRARALSIAKGIATQFPAMVDQFDNRTVGNGSVKLIVTSGPSVQNAPVLPRKGLNLLYGIAAGLVLGLVLAVLRYLRDTTLRRREEVEEITGVPVIGSIDYVSAAKLRPIVLDLDTPSPRAEEFRQLRTNVQFIDAATPLSTLVVTSSHEEEGKSSTAANVALVFAESGRSVLLLEADLRRPRVAEYFGLERTVGLTNVLASRVPLDVALQPWRDGALTILASGSIPPNPSELLGSTAMRELLQDLQSQFDLIVIDTPPLLPVTDAAVVAAFADGVLLVCRHGRTKRAQLTAAIRALRAVNARVVGTVFSMVPSRQRQNSGYTTYGYARHSHRRWPRKSRGVAAPVRLSSASGRADAGAQHQDRFVAEPPAQMSKSMDTYRSSPDYAASDELVTTTVADEAPTPSVYFEAQPPADRNGRELYYVEPIAYDPPWMAVEDPHAVGLAAWVGDSADTVHSSATHVDDVPSLFDETADIAEPQFAPNLEPGDLSGDFEIATGEATPAVDGTQLGELDPLGELASRQTPPHSDDRPVDGTTTDVGESSEPTAERVEAHDVEDIHAAVVVGADDVSEVAEADEVAADGTVDLADATDVDDPDNAITLPEEQDGGYVDVLRADDQAGKETDNAPVDDNAPAEASDVEEPAATQEPDANVVEDSVGPQDTADSSDVTVDAPVADGEHSGVPAQRGSNRRRTTNSNSRRKRQSARGNGRRSKR